jgi:hypothetical protein
MRHGAAVRIPAEGLRRRMSRDPTSQCATVAGVTDNHPGSKRVALVVVIAPVVAVLAIAMLLYFTSP